VSARIPRLPALAPSILGGVILAVALAALAKLGSLSVNAWAASGGVQISAVALAIAIGIFWRNVIGVSARLEPGLQWVMQWILRAGIALVGLRLTLEGIATVGLIALPVAIACIGAAIAASLAIGRHLGLTREFAALLALGTSVCGCTAVVAAAPVLRARPVDTGLAITCVVLVGSCGMLLYPWIADALFRDNVTAAGVFLGTSIHDTSQVMGAALIYAQQFGAPDILPVAGFTKLLRNLSMLILIPMLAIWANSGSQKTNASASHATREQVIPTFLIAFIAFALARTAGDALFQGSSVEVRWEQAVAAGLAGSELLLVCGMTAVGLSVSLRDLKTVGLRGATAALIVAIAVAVCSLMLTPLIQGAVASAAAG